MDKSEIVPDEKKDSGSNVKVSRTNSSEIHRKFIGNS